MPSSVDVRLSKALSTLVLWARKYIAIHRIPRRCQNSEIPVLDAQTFSDILSAALIPPYQVMAC